MSKIKYFSMFTGIGGFENAFDRGGGWDCVGFSEIDPYPIKIYKYHYPKHKNYGNATTIIASELPDFDLLCGGFPCQAFSVAGKRAGFEDTRGTLFFDIARIAKEKRPRFLLLENVKGLLSHDNGRTFKTIITTLEQLGYGVQWKVFNSKNNGVPQNRERVYIFANYGSPPEPEILLNPGTDEQGTRAVGRNIDEAQIVPTIRASQDKQSDNNTLVILGSTQKNAAIMENESPTLNSAMGQGGGQTPMIIEDFYKDRGVRVFEDEAPTLRSDREGLKIVEPPGRRGTKDMRVFDDTAPTVTSRFGTGGNNVSLVVPVASPDVLNKKQNGIRFKNNGDPIHTLTARDRHGVYDGNLIRKITPLECERLQGFPDHWTQYGIDENGKTVEMSDSRRYRAIGNAITVNIPAWIKTNIERVYKL
jgi:DNA (cytosine-5)-methyltransferase 1